MKEHGEREFTNIKSSGQPIHYFLSIKKGIEAAELALERQKQFYEWVNVNAWDYYPSVEMYIHLNDNLAKKPKTTEELYKIWEEESNG